MSNMLSIKNKAPAHRFKPFAAYKNSGSERLGQIPIEWDVKPLKRIFKVINGATPKSGEPSFWDGDIPWVTPDDLGSLSTIELSLAARYITQEGYESCGTTMVPAESLVLSTRAPIGHLAIAGLALCTNQGCRSLIFRNNSNRRFFYYQMLAARSELQSWGQGSTFKELATDSLGAIKLPLPPQDEQAYLAKFLDNETAKINILIAKKERLIALLLEKRAALISHAVTKGLDTNVPLQDSIVEWLGRIPAQWEILPLKRLGNIRYGLGQPPAESADGLPLLRATNVDHGRIVSKGLMYVDPADVPLSRDAKLTPGEILVVRSGAYTGDSAIVPDEYAGAIAGYDMVVSIKSANPYYVAWCLLSLEVRELQFGFYKLRAAQPHLNKEELGSILLALPPLEEQQRIIGFINEETVRIDALIAKVKEGIERLKEYRIALISAVVTGKIDVRAEAA